MEEETVALIAIVLAVIAMVGCGIVYTQIPTEEANPVTWTAITQYNDKITAIQTRLTTLEQKQTTTNYDDVLISLRNDVDDLDGDMRDVIRCLRKFDTSDFDTNFTDFEDCIEDEF